ncbi:Adenosylcobalamin/alpha-ribazole phosphatase [Mixta theicola]|nr:histidine phosphatase family protein [Mixta theicola]QHM77929.1 Adenosylcobalamin/alpha-ribazole phosphatase [Mixta theicola]
MKKWLIAFALLFSTGSVWSTEPIPASTPENSDAITIWLARHGETWLNRFGHAQGWADTPLTAEGKETTRYLGEGLKGIPFDSFYTSDAGRQRETMQIVIKQAGLQASQVRELTGLREVFFGSFEGTPDEVMQDAGARKMGLSGRDGLFAQLKAGAFSIDRYIDGIAAADPQGYAENFSQVKSRTQQALHTIIANAKQNGEKNVLVVSSGMALMVMISDLTDDPRKNHPLANAAVIKMTYQNGKFNVTELGTQRYINEGKRALDKNSARQAKTL